MKDNLDISMYKRIAYLLLINANGRLFWKRLYVCFAYIRDITKQYVKINVAHKEL